VRLPCLTCAPFFFPGLLSFLPSFHVFAVVSSSPATIIRHEKMYTAGIASAAMEEKSLRVASHANGWRVVPYLPGLCLLSFNERLNH